MSESIFSGRDRITVAAVEIISESGLASLNEQTICLKVDTSPEMIYKLFGGTEQVLHAVVEYFVRFDQSITRTVQRKDCSYRDKIRFFFETYSIYYDNYPEIAAIVLNYEELLHNTETREIIGDCIEERNRILLNLIEGAYRENELRPDFSAIQLKCILMGILQTQLLDRRVTFHEQTLKDEVMGSIEKMLSLLEVHEGE